MIGIRRVALRQLRLDFGAGVGAAWFGFGLGRVRGDFSVEFLHRYNGQLKRFFFGNVASPVPLLDVYAKQLSLLCSYNSMIRSSTSS